MKFAHYGSAESVTYYNGTGYVVRREIFPATTFGPAGPVTRQGSAVLVGARQGLTDDSQGFRFDRYRRPDTDPAFSPPRF